jgi:fibronectin-binding autotransporter adhesin
MNFGDVTPSHNWILDNNGNSANTIQMAVSAGVPQIWVHNQTATISARLVGPQGFEKRGAGFLRLTGNNSFGGGVFLYQGTLGIDSNASLGGPTSNLLINGGTLLTMTSINSDRPIILQGAGGTINTNGFDSTFSGGVGNAGELTKTGPGLLRLNSNNNYAGGTFVNEGTFIFNYAPFAIPASGIISVSPGAKVGLEAVGPGNFGFGTFGNQMSLSNSTLEFRSNLGGSGQFAQSVWFGDITLTGNSTIATNAGVNLVGRVDGFISGSGNLFTSGYVRLTNANPFTGQTRISSGELLLTSPNALAGSTLHLHANDSGSVRFEGITSATVGSLVGTRPLTLINNAEQPVALTIGVNGSNNHYNGAFSGTGSLIKAGNGTHFLHGASSHSGGTILSAGTLSVDSDTNLGAPAATLTFGGGTLQHAANGFLSSRPITLGPAGGTIDTNSYNPIYIGNFGGNGSLSKVGTGTLRLGAQVGRLEQLPRGHEYQWRRPHFRVDRVVRRNAALRQRDSQYRLDVKSRVQRRRNLRFWHVRSDGVAQPCDYASLYESAWKPIRPECTARQRVAVW